MIFTSQTFGKEIERFILEYPCFSIIHEDTNMVNLRGALVVNRSFNKFYVYKEYPVEIQIPINSERLPIVIDLENNISKDYRHRYKNGQLCLETDTRIRLDFVKGFDLVTWIKKYVETYFFTYEYYQYCGEFPYGEREHGCMGILQTYQDILGTNDVNSTFCIIKYIKEHNYRGHGICPCGSGHRIRNCHGDKMKFFYNDERKRKILFDDVNGIIREINGENYNRRN